MRKLLVLALLTSAASAVLATPIKVSDGGVYKVLAIGPEGASFCTPAKLTVTPNGLTFVVR